MKVSASQNRLGKRNGSTSAGIFANDISSTVAGSCWGAIDLDHRLIANIEYAGIQPCANQPRAVGRIEIGHDRAARELKVFALDGLMRCECREQLEDYVGLVLHVIADGAIDIDLHRVGTFP